MAVAIALEVVASLSLLDNTYIYSSMPSELAANVMMVTEDVLHVGTVKHKHEAVCAGSGCSAKLRSADQIVGNTYSRP